MHLDPGGVVLLAEPLVEVVTQGDGNLAVSIKVGTPDQLGWALAKLRDRIPDFRVTSEQVRALARGAEGFHAGEIGLSICLGGRDYFRGAIKACINLLGVNFPEVVLSREFDNARSFDRLGEGEMSRFVRWVAREDKLALPQIGAADHFLGLVTREHSIEGVVQFFGAIVHAIRLSDSYFGPPIKLAYLVDPFRGTVPAEMRNPDFSEQSIPLFEQQLKDPGAEVWAACRARVSRIVAQHFERADQEMVAGE